MSTFNISLNNNTTHYIIYACEKVATMQGSSSIGAAFWTEDEDEAKQWVQDWSAMYRDDSAWEFVVDGVDRTVVISGELREEAEISYKAVAPMWLYRAVMEV